MKKTLFSIAALLAPVFSLAAFGPQQYQYSQMSLAGTARDKIICDVNGDKKLDLLMIYTKASEEDKSHLAIFLQNASLGFAPVPTWDYFLPSDLRSFDCGNVADAPGDEFVAFRDSGVFYFDKSDGKFGKLVPLIQSPTIFRYAEYRNPSRQHFLADFDQDGVPELISPEIGGPSIYKKSPTGNYQLFQKVKLSSQLSYKVGSWGDLTHTDDINQFLRFRTYMKRTSATYTVPDLFVEDFNGDKKPDLIGILGNDLWVYCQEDGGKFADKPCLHFDRSVLTSSEKKLGFMGEMLTFVDLNMDGIADIIKVKFGSVEQRVNIQYMIYYGKPGLVYPAVPDQKISSAGFRADFGAYDMNRDGKRDFVVPFFHFAPAQAFKMLTDNSVKVQFKIYLIQPNGRYAQDPGNEFAKTDQRIQLNYRINILGIIMDPEAMIRGEFNPLIYFGADVNGDGFPDLVADNGADSLNIYFGNKAVDFKTQTPSQSLGLESSWAYDFADLNQDQRMDLITYYESEERVKEKRKAMEEAKKSQASPGSAPAAVSEEDELKKIAEAKEETRIKVIIWK